MSETSEKPEKVIQFLVSPQNDFIKPIKDGEVPPNKLHVGLDAVTKLRGPSGAPDDPFVDTVEKFFDDSKTGTENLYVILDEDWHSKFCDEFETFGEHCVKGTKGAALPEGLQKFRFHKRCDSIQANSINISADDQFKPTIEKYCGTTKAEKIRAGIIGVWTHVKVEYLLIALNTVYPKLKFSNIGICEPLCASPNREDHDRAIKKFEDLYEVKVYRDCDKYCREWLGLDC